MLFSVSACLVFVASTERKIGLLPSMAIHISVTTCDACAADHVVKFTASDQKLEPGKAWERGYAKLQAIENWTVGSLVPRPLPDFISQPWRKIGRMAGINSTSRTGNGGLG